LYDNPIANEVSLSSPLPVNKSINRADTSSGTCIINAMTFLAPFMLTALLALPALWWLMRLTPPKPQKFDFPPLRLLLSSATDETPAQLPWWLVMLRLGLAACIIVALASPVLAPTLGENTTRPLLVIVDDGWATAPDWADRMASASAAITSAERARQPVAVLTVTSSLEELSTLTPAQARERLNQLRPLPVMGTRLPHLAAITTFVRNHGGASIVWLADGLASGDGTAFAQGLSTLAPGNVLVQVPVQAAKALVNARNAPSALTVNVLRAEAGLSETVNLRALDARGRPIGDTSATFARAARETEAGFNLPVELRNEVASVSLAGQASAAGVQLLDSANRRRTVGIVSGSTNDNAQPLIAPGYYITRALAPIADMRTAQSRSPSEAVQELISAGVSMLVLADVGTLTPEARAAIMAWRNKGGVLLRFAGPRLASSDEDEQLLPVILRRGGRTLGGALAWSTPQPMGEFTPDSPFQGLDAAPDVRISRQVLAEPSPELANRTWAMLSDGTPLVTARRDGQGLTVLFHISAETSWSNLPLSGLFVDMLGRLTQLAGNVPALENTGQMTGEPSARTLPPVRVLDGYGHLQPPSPAVRPLPQPSPHSATVEHPPGLYGSRDASTALNTLPPNAQLSRLDLSAMNVRVQHFSMSQPVSLIPWLLGAALAAFLADTLIALMFGGAFVRLLRRHVAGALVATMAIFTVLPDAQAQQAPEASAAIEATRETRLAYMITGDANVDAVSKAGLEGLSAELTSRTALEPGAPSAVNPEKDELAFYSLIYWPISATARQPSQAALQKVDAFMKQGGTVLFDTRDAGTTLGSASPAGDALKAMLSRLDIPELQTVPEKHVLTRTFYLMNNFPGRFSEGPLWIEAVPQTEDEEAQLTRAGDGVSPILITSNDLAGAWAINASGQALLPTDTEDYEQREMSYRAGINIVMYAFTGNYKADQVHVPALLERLGQ
jgi:hypothetical protein